MTDTQSPADPVGDDDIGAEAITEAPLDTTDERASDDDAPASDDADKADEAESRSKKRREERKQALARAQSEAEEKAAEVRRVTETLDRIRKAGEGKKPPVVSAFENYDDYIAARAVYAARRANDDDRAESVAVQKTEAEQAAQAAQQRATDEATQLFQDAATDARQKYADFDAVVFDKSVPISAQVAQLISFSDTPAELAYAVAKDRVLAGKLSGMNPIEAARELGRMEMRLVTAKPRTETKAPEPITPVRGKGGAARDPLKMSPEEFAKWRSGGGTF